MSGPATVNNTSSIVWVRACVRVLRPVWQHRPVGCTVVSTWYCRSRDKPNSSTPLPSRPMSMIKIHNMNERACFSHNKTTEYSVNMWTFLGYVFDPATVSFFAMTTAGSLHPADFAILRGIVVALLKTWPLGYFLAVFLMYPDSPGPASIPSVASAFCFDPDLFRF